MSTDSRPALAALGDAQQLAARIPRGAFWGVAPAGEQQLVAYGLVTLFGVEDWPTLLGQLQEGVDAMNASVVDCNVFPNGELEQIWVCVVSWPVMRMRLTDCPDAGAREHEQYSNRIDAEMLMSELNKLSWCVWKAQHCPPAVVETGADAPSPRFRDLPPLRHGDPPGEPGEAAAFAAREAIWGSAAADDRVRTNTKRAPTRAV